MVGLTWHYDTYCDYPRFQCHCMPSSSTLACCDSPMCWKECQEYVRFFRVKLNDVLCESSKCQSEVSTRGVGGKASWCMLTYEEGFEAHDRVGMDEWARSLRLDNVTWVTSCNPALLLSHPASPGPPMHALPPCYALSQGSPDLEFGFGFRVLEARVGMDGASASRSLCQLCFHIWYLATGSGHITGRDMK